MSDDIRSKTGRAIRKTVCEQTGECSNRMLAPNGSKCEATLMAIAVNSEAIDRTKRIAEVDG